MLWLIMRESLWTVALGIMIGAPVAFAGDRLIRSVRFDLHGTDAIRLFAAAGILLLVAAVAGYLPARRASLIDPLAA